MGPTLAPWSLLSEICVYNFQSILHVTYYKCIGYIATELVFRFASNMKVTPFNLTSTKPSNIYKHCKKHPCRFQDLSHVNDFIQSSLSKLPPFRKQHFPANCIFLNQNEWISNKISPKFVPKGLINNIAALVQIMSWCRPGYKSLSEPMVVRLRTHICVTRPQWINILEDLHTLTTPMTCQVANWKILSWIFCPT